MALLSILLVQGNVHLAGAPAYVHARSIDYDSSQPGGHLRLPLELVKMCVGGQESILDRIFGICRVAHQAQCYPSEGRPMAGDNICLIAGPLLGDRTRSALVYH